MPRSARCPGRPREGRAGEYAVHDGRIGAERREDGDAGGAGGDLARDRVLRRGPCGSDRTGLDQHRLRRAEQPTRAELVSTHGAEVDGVLVEPDAAWRAPAIIDDRP